MFSRVSRFLLPSGCRLAGGLLLGLLTGLGSARATTYVVFRYDDLAADKAGSRSFDKPRQAIWEAEQAQDRIFARHGMPYLVAVVPNMANVVRTNVVPLAEDQEKVAFLRASVAAGRMQVALHGYTHWNHASPGHRRGEFRRADAQAQADDLAAGRKMIMDALGLRELTTFVPPFNGWNEHTAAGLARTGFTILSADRQWNVPADIPLLHIPFTAQLWELESLIARNALPPDSVVVVLYHPAQITKMPGSEMRYYGLDKLDSLLARLGTLPDVKVVTLDQLRATGQDLSPARYNAAVSTGRLQAAWAQVLPTRYLPGIASQFLYLSAGDYAGINLAWRALTVVTLAGLVLAGWLVFGLARRLLPLTANRLLSVGALLALAAAAWLLLEITRRGFHPTSVRFFPPWLLIGWILAALKHELGLRRQAADTVSPS